jgi:hypothetical protein
MSSHREAPSISRDPVADNTDLYAFVDPVDSTKVTILSNFIPLEEPAGGPNFFQFGDDVLYEIMIDNDGDGIEDVTYQFRFKTTVGNPNTFLYNTGPIGSLEDPSWNVRQRYSVTRVAGPRRTGAATVLATDLASPPVNIGPRSTPAYAALADAAIHSLPGGRKVFAGQRDEGFFVDLGSIFDLAGLRPFNGAHLIPLPPMPGKDDTKGYNVHTIALQVPKTDLTRDGYAGTDSADPRSSIGIWSSASRQKALVRSGVGHGAANPESQAGPWVQVSRLGNPLINEVIIPLGKKDYWNSTHPKDDAQFTPYYTDPELQHLIALLYGGAFPMLSAFVSPAPGAPPVAPRVDLVAILLTGIPLGLIPALGAFNNFTGPVQADYLRLNVGFAPGGTSPFGLLGGDFDGFPNGRRVFDDTVAIELRVVGGATLPLVAPLLGISYTADPAAAVVDDGVTANEGPYLTTFPYLAHPHAGYEHGHD